MTKRVNFKLAPYDIFIGRPSKWGNPYHLGKDGTREEVIAKYEEYIRNRPKLLKDLVELSDKILGCYCSLEQHCHGDVLIKLLKERGVK